MPNDTLARIRRTAEQAAAPMGLEARIAIDRNGAAWLLAMIPIVEAIADPDYMRTRIPEGAGETEMGCRFCESVPYSYYYYDADPSQYVEIDGLRHDVDCLFVAAVRLKEGKTGSGSV